MKVMMLNGSPNRNGCTAAALGIIADELKNQGVESEIIWLGNKAVRGCIGCGGCRRNGMDRCVFGDDGVADIAERLKEADGYVFGAPVHYSSPNGATISALDRIFYSAGKAFRFKPAACIVSARRAGTTASYDVLNKYIGINNMIMVPATNRKCCRTADAHLQEKCVSSGEALCRLCSQLLTAPSVLKAEWELVYLRYSALSIDFARILRLALIKIQPPVRAPLCR